MHTNELKFLLKLLGCTDYRSSLSKIELNKQTRASEREKICRQLRERNLVECSDEVTKLKIAPPGKALLMLDSSELPVKDKELKVLRASEKEKITPGKTNIPAAERQAIIQGLAERGLIQVETKIKEVWLSERGQEYLRDDYIPSKGVQPILSLDLLNNYLQFLRKSLRALTQKHPTVESKLSDEEILQTIRDLDKELGTENYLPIFHLRQKLQPPLPREELDQGLYRLQGNDKIELRTLLHAQDYTQEQVNAGISQSSGSPLFFIKVTVN